MFYNVYDNGGFKGKDFSFSDTEWYTNTPISTVQSAVKANNTGASLSLTVPSGVTTSDIIILARHYENSSTDRPAVTNLSEIYSINGTYNSAQSTQIISIGSGYQAGDTVVSTASTSLGGHVAILLCITTPGLSYSSISSYKTVDGTSDNLNFDTNQFIVQLATGDGSTETTATFYTDSGADQIGTYQGVDGVGGRHAGFQVIAGQGSFSRIYFSTAISSSWGATLYFDYATPSKRKNSGIWSMDAVRASKLN